MYNVEPYIQECLNPLTKLNDQMIEVIIINDETPDNSMSVVENYVGKIPNLKIVNQKNKGLSGARNTGLSIAQGKYIFFYDSDDFVDPENFRKLCDEAFKNDLDICAGKGSIFQNQELTPIKKDNKRRSLKISDGKTYFFEITKNKEFSPMVWLNIYRKDFLNSHQITFSEGLIHEDEEFTAKCLAKAQRVAYFPYDFYRYRFREGSISKLSGHKYLNPKSLPSFIKIIKNLQALAESSSAREIKLYYTVISKCHIEILRRLQYRKKNHLLQIDQNWKTISEQTDFKNLPLKFKIPAYRLLLKLILTN